MKDIDLLLKIVYRFRDSLVVCLKVFTIKFLKSFV